MDLTILPVSETSNRRKNGFFKDKQWYLCTRTPFVDTIDFDYDQGYVAVNRAFPCKKDKIYRYFSDGDVLLSSPDTLLNASDYAEYFKEIEITEPKEFRQMSAIYHKKGILLSLQPYALRKPYANNSMLWKLILVSLPNHIYVHREKIVSDKIADAIRLMVRKEIHDQSKTYKKLIEAVRVSCASFLDKFRLD